MYIGRNWNFRLALRILREEIRGELHYGLKTSGYDDLRDLSKQGIDTVHSTIYMPVSYVLMEKLLAAVPAGCRKHFFDFGCGKGRALCLAAQAGFDKVTGVDFSEKFCTMARKNLQKTENRKKGFGFTVIHGRAEDTELPGDVDCVFLFNPFDESTLEKVLENISQSLREKPRKLHLIYVNPIYREILHAFGYRELFHTSEMTYLEAAIFSVEPMN